MFQSGIHHCGAAGATAAAGCVTGGAKTRGQMAGLPGCRDGAQSVNSQQTTGYRGYIVHVVMYMGRDLNRHRSRGGGAAIGYLVRLQ